MSMKVLFQPSDELHIVWQNVLDNEGHCSKNLIDVREFQANIVLKLGVKQQIWN